MIALSFSAWWIPWILTVIIGGLGSLWFWAELQSGMIEFTGPPVVVIILALLFLVWMVFFAALYFTR